MKAKAPEPEFTGDLGGAPNQGRHPGATKSLQKRRELENKKKFINGNASRKQPFHIDCRGMNFVKKFLAFLLILISSSLFRVLFSF